MIRPDDAETTSKGGVFLPQNARRETQTGVIMAVGKTVQDVKVGHRVVFPRYHSGTEFKRDGGEYKVMGEGELLAIVEGD